MAPLEKPNSGSEPVKAGWREPFTWLTKLLILASSRPELVWLTFALIGSVWALTSQLFAKQSRSWTNSSLSGLDFNSSFSFGLPTQVNRKEASNCFSSLLLLSPASRKALVGTEGDQE